MAQRRHISRIFRVGHSEFLTLILLALIAGGAWIFAEIADEVTEGATVTFDQRVLLAFRNPNDPRDPLGPRWMEEMGRDFTALGSVGVLLAITAAVAGFLLLDGKRHLALFTVIAVLGGFALGLALKGSFERERPRIVPHGAYVMSSSFPSGHSMMSAATFLTLGAMLARSQSKRRLKIYLMGVAVALTVIVGVSRVYLGVHWPTDVLAGWTAGAVWAAICWVAARVLQMRGKVEQEDESSK
jgi:undecaprenyl-diphosphatase